MTDTDPREPRMLRQVAPWPQELEDIVEQMTYRPGWTFTLADVDRGQGSEGLTLCVVSQGYDTYAPEKGETYQVMHYMPVPPASFKRASWEAWVRDTLLAIERHECCEFLQIGGVRPFAPLHGPGDDPYVIWTYSDDLARRTRFDGTVAPE